VYARRMPAGLSDRDLAERLVRAAGEIALGLRGGPAGVKGLATDVVTEADVRAEAAMVELLLAQRPGDGVRGEEGAAVAGEGGGRSWLLDPVDGTLNYARGLPAWCSAACVVDAAGALACAVLDPVGDELWSAARGEGSAGAVSAPALGDAVVATFVDVRRRDAEVVAGTGRVLREVGALRSVGCGTLELAWVAAGRLDAWVQADVEPWDWHPGALLVAEAGGTVRVVGRWHVAARSAALADELVACVGAGERRH
jgi:myo-inositol-1(or 4)-monophosphatase